MRIRLLRPKANRQIRIPRLIPHLHSVPHTDRTDLTVLLCGREISRMPYAGLLQCLTQIAQISRFPFVDGKSHRCSTQACSNASHRSHRSHGFALWTGNLTEAPRRLAPMPHTDCTELTVLLCGWEISQMPYAGLLQCLTQIAQISRFCFVGGKSHRGSTQACSNASHRFNEIQQKNKLC